MTALPPAGREAPPPRPAYGAHTGDEAGPDHGRWQAPAEAPQRTSSLADALEPGGLRDELVATAAAPAAAAARPAPATGHAARLQFTGEGGEYFRIWVVNTLLTLATLGIYSAWAKVRKTRYFWQNTRLDGYAFDFHGNPGAILVGRLVALALVAAYSFAFEFSRTAGLVTIALLCVVGPWLFMRAQRFRLANTSWRGLRFGFQGSAAEAYLVALPPMLVWFSGAIVAVLGRERIGLSILTALLTMALWPWMHHRLKAWQHDRACYGERRFAFLPATRGFYAVYFVAGVLALGMGAVAAVGGSAALAFSAAMGSGRAAAVTAVLAVALTSLLVALAFLAAWPYFAARLQALVWAHTRVGDVRFATAIAAWPLGRLVAKNTLLTVLTAGLYWPYAAVALARYRVECLRAVSQQPLVALAATTRTGARGAAGDAAVDAFGLDIGL